MKKLFILLCAVMMSIALFAEDGYGTCKIDGTNDYVEVSVDLGNGLLRVASTRPVVSVLVKVVVKEYCSANERGENYGPNSPQTYTTTIYNDRVYAITSQPKEIRISIPNKHSYHQRFEVIEVSVNNPVCK